MFLCTEFETEYPCTLSDLFIHIHQHPSLASERLVDEPCLSCVRRQNAHLADTLILRPLQWGKGEEGGGEGGKGKGGRGEGKGGEGQLGAGSVVPRGYFPPPPTPPHAVEMQAKFWTIEKWWAHRQHDSLLTDGDRPYRAGHFRYFWIFSITKNDFFALFIKLITCFCTSPI